MSAAVRRMGAFFAVAAGVVILDQLTKVWALNALGDGRRVELLGQWLSFTLVYNSGAAFSLGANITWLLTIVALGVTVTIVLFARRLQSTSWAVVLGLLLGGALGNLIDRLARQPGLGRGHVVDFIAYGSWFVGNVADIAIVAAAVLIVILVLRGVPLTIKPADGGTGGAAHSGTANVAKDGRDVSAEPGSEPPASGEPGPSER